MSVERRCDRCGCILHHPGANFRLTSTDLALTLQGVEYLPRMQFTVYGVDKAGETKNWDLCYGCAAVYMQKMHDEIMRVERGT